MMIGLDDRKCFNEKHPGVFKVPLKKLMEIDR